MVVVEVAAPAAPTAAARPSDDAGAVPDGSALAALLDQFRRRTKERIDLVSGAVRPDVTREGLLQPSANVGLYRKLYRIDVARSALLIGRSPSPFFAYFFAGFATVLFFLAIGLRALRAGATPAAVT
jgi:hypothetical protein